MWMCHDSAVMVMHNVLLDGLRVYDFRGVGDVKEAGCKRMDNNVDEDIMLVWLIV